VGPAAPPRRRTGPASWKAKAEASARVGSSGARGDVLPLIDVGEDGRFSVNEECAAALNGVRRKIAVVVVTGVYRSGKSFLTNLLLGRAPGTGSGSGGGGDRGGGDRSGDPARDPARSPASDGFSVGHSIRSCTRGIWCCTRPLDPEELRDAGTSSSSDDTAVILLDTEGLAAAGRGERGQAHDDRIFTLAMLLASKMVYNAVGTITETSIQQLGLIGNMCARVADGEGDEAGALVFPSFTWLLRDFALSLRDAGGGKISPTQYMEQALRRVEEVDARSRRRNSICAMLKRFFPDRECATLVRPAEDEAVLQDIQSHLAELRPEFLAQARSLRRTLLRGLRPKTLRGSAVTGAGFVQLLRCYVDAINDGAVPSVEGAWASAVRRQCEGASEAAEERMASALAEARKGLPVEAADLAATFDAVSAEALAVFDARVGSRTVASQQQRSALDAKLDAARNRLEARNAAASRDACESLLRGLFAAARREEEEEEARQKGGDGLGGAAADADVTSLWDRHARVMDDYAQRAVGPAREVVGVEIGTRALRDAVERRSKLRSETLMAAERRLAAAGRRFAEAESEAKRLRGSLDSARGRSADLAADLAKARASAATAQDALKAAQARHARALAEEREASAAETERAVAEGAIQLENRFASERRDWASDRKLALEKQNRDFAVQRSVLEREHAESERSKLEALQRSLCAEAKSASEASEAGSRAAMLAQEKLHETALAAVEAGRAADRKLLEEEGEALRARAASELEALRSDHARTLRDREARLAEGAASRRALEASEAALRRDHEAALELLEEEGEALRARAASELEALRSDHARTLRDREARLAEGAASRRALEASEAALRRDHEAALEEAAERHEAVEASAHSQRAETQAEIRRAAEAHEASAEAMRLEAARDAALWDERAEAAGRAHSAALEAARADATARLAAAEDASRSAAAEAAAEHEASLSGAREAAAAELRALRAEADARAGDARAAHAATLEAQERSAEAALEASDTKAREGESRHAAALARCEAEARMRLGAAEEALCREHETAALDAEALHADALASLERAHLNEAEEIARAHAAAVEQLESTSKAELAQTEALAEETRTAHADALRRAALEAAARLSAAEASLQGEHSAALEAASKRHADALSALEARTAAELSDAAEAHAAAAEAHRAAAASELAQRRASLESARTAHDASMERAQEEAAARLTAAEERTAARAVAATRSQAAVRALQLELSAKRCVASGQRGMVVTKFHAKKGNDPRWIVYRADEAAVGWCREGRRAPTTLVPLREVESVVYGMRSPTLLDRAAALQTRPWRCFYIRTSKRTYNFAARSSSDAVTMCAALQTLVAKARAGGRSSLPGGVRSRGSLLWRQLCWRLDEAASKRGVTRSSLIARTVSALAAARGEAEEAKQRELPEEAKQREMPEV
jgi:hypothetical protein